MMSALRREKMTENLTSSIESEFYISIRLINVLKHDLFNSSINCFFTLKPNNYRLGALSLKPN